MRTERTAAPRLAKRFLRNQRGIAAVEFALIVPVLLIAYLGATDLTQALAIDRKLGQVSATVSDLVAQRNTISRQDVHNFFQSGRAIMRPFDFDQTRLRLTIVEVEGGSAEVTGTTARNWTIEEPNGNSFALPDDIIDLSDGRYAVIATAGYQYQPMFGTVFNASVDLEKRSIHIVRQEVSDFGFPLSSADSPPPTGGTGTPGGGGSEGGGSEGGGSSGGSGGSGGGDTGGSGGGGNSGGGSGGSGGSGGGGGLGNWLRCVLLGIC